MLIIRRYHRRAYIDIDIDLTEVHRSQAEYGAVDQLLLRGEAQARKRVVYFLTVFTITGFASKLSELLDYIIFTSLIIPLNFVDLFVGYTFAIYETVRIQRADWHIHSDKDQLPTFPFVLFIFQVSVQYLSTHIILSWQGLIDCCRREISP